MTHVYRWRVGAVIGVVMLGGLAGVPMKSAQAQPNPDQVRAEVEARQAKERAEMRRYNRLDQVLMDLDHLLGIANNPQHAKFEPQINEAIAAWPEIAEQFPNEAKEFDQMRHAYIEAYKWMRIDEFEKASGFLSDARHYGMELAEAAQRELQARREMLARGQKPLLQEGEYENKVVPAPPKGQPFKLNGQVFGAGTDGYAAPVMVVAGRAKLEIPIDAATKMLQSGTEERGVAWEPWRVRVYNLVCNLWSQNVADHRRNVGVFRGKFSCTVSYTIRYDDYAHNYRVVNIHIVKGKSSDNTVFDREALDAVSKLDNWANDPQIRFPAGTRKKQMTIETILTFGGKSFYNPVNDIEKVPGRR